MLGSLPAIVDNNLGQGQGAKDLLASMFWDGLSNPTIYSETLVSRFGGDISLSVPRGKCYRRWQGFGECQVKYFHFLFPVGQGCYQNCLIPLNEQQSVCCGWSCDQIEYDR